MYLPNWRIIDVLKLVLGRPQTDYERLALEQVLEHFQPSTPESTCRRQRLHASLFGTREPSNRSYLCRHCGTVASTRRCPTCQALN